MAGTRRTTPFAAAAEKAAAAAADAGGGGAEGDEGSLGSFTCLRIDGSVPTPVRYGTVRYGKRMGWMSPC